MRKNNYLIKVIFIFLFFVIIIFLNFLFKIKNYKKDYLMAVVGGDGIALVNVSIERKVINFLKIDKKVNLWFSDGTGWNNQDRVKNILKDKNKSNELFFYNFGFLPDKIIELENCSDWKKISNLSKELGWGRFVYFNFFRENMIFNNELISTKLDDNFEKLSEIMVRDFVSIDKFNSEDDTKLSIINTTGEDGMASFLSSRLEWLGALVVSVGSEKRDLGQNECLIEKNEGRVENWWDKEIKELFKCKVEVNNSLSEDQLEIYFGDKFAEMIKYSSYVRTF